MFFDWLFKKKNVDGVDVIFSAQWYSYSDAQSCSVALVDNGCVGGDIEENPPPDEPCDTFLPDGCGFSDATPCDFDTIVT